ncbi:MAG: hypothetical protein ACLQMO_12255 [Acidobacteriaceae bacterium]
MRKKTVADKLRISHEDYARSVYAGDLTRNELGAKAKRAGRLVERIARSRVPDVHVDSAWLKTIDGKFRFDLDFNRSRTAIWVAEDLVDEFLESGSRIAEEKIARSIESALPESWSVKAS